MTARHPILVYTLARLGLLGVSSGVLWLLGTRGPLLLLLALVVSALLAYLLLRRQRDAVSGALEVRTARTRERLGAAAASEDDD